LSFSVLCRRRRRTVKPVAAPAWFIGWVYGM